MFVVITKIPDASKGETGNLANELDLYIKPYDAPLDTPCKSFFNEALSLNLLSPVFALGEIIVVDSNGREIGGDGRKPSKWFVDYEEFYTVYEAIAKAKEILPWA